MNRYLLFGPDCGSCSGIVGRIEKETEAHADSRPTGA